MLNPMRPHLFIMALCLCQLANAASLRIEGEHAWLNADGAPLSKVLHLFEQRGVDVLIDPSLDMGRVSGEWEETKVERLVAQLAHPNSYMVEWSRMKTPLGDLDHIMSIRIFSDGNAAAVKRFGPKNKELDVVEGEGGIKYIRGEIMVGFKEGSTISDLNALLRKINGTIIEVIDPPGIYRIKLNEGLSVEEAMAMAKKHEGVESTEPNLAYPRMDSVSVPLDGSGAGINLNLQPGETAVAIFDSGLDPKYADSPYIKGYYDAVDPSAAMSDPLGHGTLTALVAAGALTPEGSAPDEVGVPILAIKAFDPNGMTSSAIIMDALKHAANSGVPIVSMSFGSEVDSGFMEVLMNDAVMNGMILFAAAGNEPTGVPIFPAGYDSVFAVGGLDQNGQLWEKSNDGDFVSIYGSAYVWWNGKLYVGTSIATPDQAAEAAKARNMNK